MIQNCQNVQAPVNRGIDPGVVQEVLLTRFIAAGGCSGERGVSRCHRVEMRCWAHFSQGDESDTPATTEDLLLPFDLPAARRRKLIAEFADGSISADGGLVLLRAAERRFGLAETLAGCIRDWATRRGRSTLCLGCCAFACSGSPAATRTPMTATSCAARDPLFKLAVGQALESGRDLCSQPTMSRQPPASSPSPPSPCLSTRSSTATSATAVSSLAGSG